MWERGERGLSALSAGLVPSDRRNAFGGWTVQLPDVRLGWRRVHMHTPGGSMVTSAAVDADTDTDLDAGQLWAALARSREHCDPRVLAAAEDEVFRHYVPLALAVARERAPGGAPVDAERAAELGLAEAVLRWDPIGGSGFETHRPGRHRHQAASRVDRYRAP